MIEFEVVDWAAWAPGLHSREDWLAWAQSPFLPHGDDTPALGEVPAMQRRRVDRLGRMAIQTAYWCQPPEGGQIPLVFASRHGDVACSVGLLETLAAQQPLSPTAFGLSVHNAIAALYSIIRGERGNYLALAAGTSTPEAAMVEAAGLLADGAPEVLVVCYEGSLPAIYAEFADEPDPFHAWCWRLRQAGQGGRAIRLEWEASPSAAIEDVRTQELPHALEVMRFLLAGQPWLRHPRDAAAGAATGMTLNSGGWVWRQDA